MTINPPSIKEKELRDSFNRVYHGPDRFRVEFKLIEEAERLGVHIDTYRRLYELRGEEEIDPYPQPKKWWHTPGDWGKWVWHLPPKKKFALGRKGVFKLVESGVIFTIAIALGRYVWETPKREKQSHYQAWQMINSATGQETSAGRIEALQDLSKDGVSLQGLNASRANLKGIKLQNATLVNANFNKTELYYADFTDANLSEAHLHDVHLNSANLTGVMLNKADLSSAHFNNANLHNANLTDADLSDASFIKANNLTPEQIKKAHNWQSACYDHNFRIELGLSPENPEHCVEKKPKK